MTSIDRVLDDLPPDYPEALMKLIDALRDFIRSEEELGRDLLREEQITRETYDAAQKEDGAVSDYAERFGGSRV